MRTARRKWATLVLVLASAGAALAADATGPITLPADTASFSIDPSLATITYVQNTLKGPVISRIGIDGAKRGSWLVPGGGEVRNLAFLSGTMFAIARPTTDAGAPFAIDLFDAQSGERSGIDVGVGGDGRIDVSQDGQWIATGVDWCKGSGDRCVATAYVIASAVTRQVVTRVDLRASHVLASWWASPSQYCMRVRVDHGVDDIVIDHDAEWIVRRGKGIIHSQPTERDLDGRTATIHTTEGNKTIDLTTFPKEAGHFRLFQANGHALIVSTTRRPTGERVLFTRQVDAR